MVFSNKGKPDIAALLRGDKPQENIQFQPAQPNEANKKIQREIDKNLDQVRKLYKAGEISKAANLALKIHADYPFSELAAYELGNMANDRNDYETAESFFREALQRNPVSIPVSTNQAIVLARLNKLSEAEALMQNVIKMERSAKTYTIFANVYRINGKTEQAKEYLEKALLEDSEYIPALAVYAETSKIKDGDKHLEKLLNVSKKMDRMPVKDQATVHFSLGKAYFDLKNYKAVSYTHLTLPTKA